MLYRYFVSEMIEVKSQSPIPAQPIVLSSDDSNQGIHGNERTSITNNRQFTSTGCVKISESAIETRLPQKSVNVPFIVPFAKRLSFVERLELYNSDPALDYMDDEPMPCRKLYQSDPALAMMDDDAISLLMDPLSQDSIVISDDEINYSLNHCRGGGVEKSATTRRTINAPSQESIELTDDSADEIEERQSFASINAASQESIELSDSEELEGEIEERQSFASVVIGNEIDLASEKSLDINIDDEIYNSNHSLNDEDLINLSIREMCQKDFVAGSTKPSSSSKSFSRTTSDMTFERKVWKPSKTPDKLNHVSDDELDEFDKLVRGNRSQSPKLTENSIEISDDEFDELLDSRGDNICDSPASSPAQSNEFIVQSMDQMYEVRTGVLVSPKPDYDNMSSPTRLEHLKKYGLKTLPKRKAVICLEHIYNRLHPFIELDGHDDLDNLLSEKEMPTIDSDKRIGGLAVSQQSCQPISDENNFDVLQEKKNVFYLPSAPRAKVNTFRKSKIVFHLNSYFNFRNHGVWNRSTLHGII